MKVSQVDMCSGPIPMKMLLFAVPLVFSSMLQLLFNIADVVVVGRFAGRDALAAVGATSQLISLFVNFFIGVSMGVNVLIARLFGAHDDRNISDGIHTTFTLSIIGGAALTISGMLLAAPLLRLTNTPEDVIEQSSVYVRIYFLSAPAFVVYNLGTAVLKAIGDTKRPFCYLLLAGVINILLNLLFVIYLGMDSSGVAMATAISQYISAALVVRYLTKLEGPLKLDLRRLRMKREIVRGIMVIGLPAGLQTIVFNISNTIIQAVINSFGSIAVAGDTMAVNIEMLIYAATYSIYNANLTFTSQNYGAGRYENLNRILKYSLLLSGGLSIALCYPALFAYRHLLGIFTSEPEVIEFGLLRMKMLLPFYFICALMDAVVGSMRGIGNSVVPMVVSLIGACALRLLWIATVFQMSPTLVTLYLVYPVTWTLTFSAHMLCYRHYRKKLG